MTDDSGAKARSGETGPRPRARFGKGSPRETSHTAMREVAKTPPRLFRPGGVMAQCDNGPFLGTIRDEDFESVRGPSGFVDCIVAQAPHGRKDKAPAGPTFPVIGATR